MRDHNKTILTEVKGTLLILTTEMYDICDMEQVEYLIQLIDYMILGKMPLCRLTIRAFIDEIITTSIYSLNPKILSTLHKVQYLEEEVYSDSKIQLSDE